MAKSMDLVSTGMLLVMFMWDSLRMIGSMAKESTHIGLGRCTGASLRRVYLMGKEG